MQATGHPESQFAGHSFQIGVATTAASAGIEDSIICILGRWNSLVSCSISVPPRQQLASFSKSIAACHLKYKTMRQKTMTHTTVHI